jgi:8-oxo-dGTP diphosphatase
VLFRLLLLLWRRLPLPDWLRWILLYSLNARYIAGASALICDDSGGVLLFEHTYRPRYAWGLPGGWLRKGERPEDAIVRELREEASLEAVVERLWLADVDAQYPHIEFVFACRIVGGAFQPSAEVKSYRYARPDDLPRDIVPRQRTLIRRALLGEAAGPA